MKRITILLFGALLTLGLVFDTIAQEKTKFSPGTRIRVWTAKFSGKRMTGTVLSSVGDTITLTVKGQTNPLMVPVTSINRLEVTKGKKSKIVTGAVVGLFAGASLGAIVGYFGTCSTDQQRQTCELDGSVGETKAATAVISAGVLGGLGLLLGTVIGVAIKVDRWEEVPLNQIGTGPRPQNKSGLVLSVSYNFKL